MSTTVCSSNGNYEIREDGTILSDSNTEYRILRFNTQEWKDTWKKESLDSSIDILDLGYWYVKDDDPKPEYEPPAYDWREEMRHLRRGEEL